MKDRITLKMWLLVFLGGIWQFLCSIFSWKNKTPFWRVVWSVITICVVAVTSMFAYAFYDEFYVRKNRNAYWMERSNVGDHYYFFDKGRNKGKSYISEIRSGNKILTGLDWIARPSDDDSLIVFAKGGKRGFFNRYTGEIAIPAKYDAAWCFSSGVAGVCIGDSVFFIDHSDRPVNSRKFFRVQNRNYAYHGNYFPLAENGMLGLIDKSGNIAVPAVYDDILPVAKNMWNVKNGAKNGIIDDEGRLIIPCEYKFITVYPEGGIVVSSDDNSKKRLDYDGTVIDEFVYDYTYTLEYLSDEFNEEGERIMKPASLYSYSCNGRFGLIDRDGRPVTPPVYSMINAYCANIYECQIDEGGEYVLINEKGKKIND